MHTNQYCANFAPNSNANEEDCLKSRTLLMVLGIEIDNISSGIKLEEEIVKSVNALIKDNRILMDKQSSLRRDIDKLTRYIDKLQYNISLVENSRAWRLGFKIISTMKTILGRPIGRPAFIDIHYILSVYNHWKKSRD